MVDKSTDHGNSYRSVNTSLRDSRQDKLIIIMMILLLLLLLLLLISNSLNVHVLGCFKLKKVF